jgi:hypothetical protein
LETTWTASATFEDSGEAKMPKRPVSLYSEQMAVHWCIHVYWFRTRWYRRECMPLPVHPTYLPAQQSHIPQTNTGLEENYPATLRTPIDNQSNHMVLRHSHSSHRCTLESHNIIILPKHAKASITTMFGWLSSRYAALISKIRLCTGRNSA